MPSQPVVLARAVAVTGNVNLPSVFTGITGPCAVAITITNDNFTSADLRIQESEGSFLVTDASLTWLQLATQAISVNGTIKVLVTTQHFNRLRVAVENFVGTSFTLTVTVEGEKS